MKNGWHRTHTTVLRFAMALLLMSVVATTIGETRFAYAQTGDETSSRIEDYAHNASFMSERIEARVRQVRTIVYVTLALTVISLAITAYVALQHRLATDENRPAGGRIDPYAWLRERGAFALVRRRQRKLMRAVSELQSFADQIRDSHSEMSGLLVTITAELKDIEKTVEPQSAAPKS